MSRILTRYHELILLFLFFLLAFVLRLYYISNNNIHFWYDQARDAAVSQEIYRQADIKIQGPPAAGTNETVYHGVIYYYLIGLLYFIFGGNPFFVSASLAFINSFTVVPIYLLSKDITKSKLAGIIAVLLTIFSLENIHSSTWLSNPSLALLFITSFYYFLWKVFYRNQKKYILFLSLSLGLTHQAIIFSFFLWVSLFIVWYIFVLKKKVVIFRKKDIVLFCIIFLLTVSSILFTQIRLASVGIFTPKVFLANSLVENAGINKNILNISSLYFRKIVNSISPTFQEFSILIGISLIFFLVINRKKYKNPFFHIWLSAPLWLLILYSHPYYHVLTGIEVVIYIYLAIEFYSLSKKTFTRIISIIFFTIYLLSNFLAIKNYKNTSISQIPLAQSQGALLNSQLALIDYTYEIAQGKQFSLSTLTNPLYDNITWSYLYSWYGKAKYGYVPSYYGPIKDVYKIYKLPVTAKPQAIHFAVFEPDPGIASWFIDEFTNQQNSYYGMPKVEKKFASIELKVYSKD